MVPEMNLEQRLRDTGGADIDAVSVGGTLRGPALDATIQAPPESLPRLLPKLSIALVLPGAGEPPQGGQGSERAALRGAS